MAEDAAPKAPTLAELDKKLQATIELMHYDATRHKDNAFKPSYSPDTSQMKVNLNELINKIAPEAEPGAAPVTSIIPEDLVKQVKNLSTTCDTAVQNILQNQTNESAFKKDFQAVVKAVEAEITPLGDAPEKAAQKTQLMELKAALEDMQNNAVMNEIKKMNENLRRQNEANIERALNLEAMVASKDKKGIFEHNDWRNESTNDIIRNENSSGNPALSSGGILHSGADGMYTKPNSRYNVFKATDPKTGEASYTASYTNQNEGFFKTLGRVIVESAGILVKFYGSVTLVIPALEAASYLLSKTVSAITQGAVELPYRVPFETLTSAGKVPILPQGETTRGLVQAEIDVAARRGKEHMMRIDTTSNTLTASALEKAVVKLDELCIRAGYKAAIFGSGQIGAIQHPHKAMEAEIGMQFQKVLAAMNASNALDLSEQTKSVLKSFHRQQTGSSYNFDVNKFKEMFMRQARGFQDAMQVMKQNMGYANADRATATKGNEGTSVITPTKGEPTPTGSIITPTSPPPSPSAPPAEPGTPVPEGQLAAGKKKGTTLERLPMPEPASPTASPDSSPESSISARRR